MTQPLNLIGNMFGRWLVIERTENNKYGNTQWLCECQCYKKTRKVMRGQDIKKLKKQSCCGCLREEFKNENFICEICNTKVDVSFYNKYNKYLCAKHYLQLVRHGYTKKTRFDKNEIIIYNDSNYAEIILYDICQNETGRAIIDIEDIQKCRKYKWRLDEHGYAITSIYDEEKITNLLLHHYIKNRTSEIEVDHIDRNRLNNRKNNLRFCEDKFQNKHNMSLSKRNTSGFIGISWSNRKDMWRSRLNYHNICFELGYFNNIQDAVLERLKAERKYFKEFKNPYNENEYIKQFGMDDKIKTLLN